MPAKALSSSRLGLDTNGAEHEDDLQTTWTSEDAAHGHRNPRRPRHYRWTMDKDSKDPGPTLEGPPVDIHAGTVSRRWSVHYSIRSTAYSAGQASPGVGRTGVAVEHALVATAGALRRGYFLGDRHRRGGEAAESLVVVIADAGRPAQIRRETDKLGENLQTHILGTRQTCHRQSGLDQGDDKGGLAPRFSVSVFSLADGSPTCSNPSGLEQLPVTGLNRFVGGGSYEALA